MGIEQVLQEDWLGLRDDYTRRSNVVVCVDFLQRAGLLSQETAELWLLRTEKCPGHEDEGGRDWCAYCGKMKTGGE